MSPLRGMRGAMIRRPDGTCGALRGQGAQAKQIQMVQDDREQLRRACVRERENAHQEQAFAHSRSSLNIR